MRWEHKYPRVRFGEDTDSGLLHYPSIGKCFMCQSETHWIDLCFEGRLCSEECEAEAYEDIARRTRQDADDCY